MTIEKPEKDTSHRLRGVLDHYKQELKFNNKGMMTMTIIYFVLAILAILSGLIMVLIGVLI